MKNKTMDRKLLSKQKHEIKKVATKYGLTQKYVRELQAEVGVSRKAVEAEILRRGFKKILTNKKQKS